MLYAVAGFMALLIIWFTYKSPRLTTILFWSFVAAIFSSSALLLLLPGEFGHKAIWISLSVPVIWVALQFWCYWDQSQWRVVYGHIAITVLCGIAVFLTEPVLS